MKNDMSFLLCLLVMMLASSVCWAEDRSLFCENVGDSLVCKFELFRRSQAQQEMTTCVDGFCVKARVSVVLEENKLHDQAASMAEGKVLEGSPKLETPAINVGEGVYKHPYNQYRREISELLQVHGDWYNDFDKADWYTNLGLAHRDATQVERALEALHESEKVLDAINTEAPRDRGRVVFYKAAVYYYLGDIHAEKTSKEDIAVAVGYLSKSDDLYRQAIEDNTLRMDPLDRLEASVNRAVCLVRLGLLAIDGYKGDLDKIVHRELFGEDLDVVPGDPQQTQRFDGDDLADLVKRSNEASAYFSEAIRLYTYVIGSERNEDERRRINLELATAFRHKATAANIKGDLETVAECEHDALVLYREVVTGLSEDEQLDVYSIMADLMYSIAEAVLLQGEIEKSEKMYDEAMALFEKYDFPPIEAVTGGLVVGEGDIEAYEQALDDYRASLKGGYDPSAATGIDDFDEEAGDAVLPHNDGYEGDLHAGLGAMHMATGDLLLATSHFIEAIQLYERTGDGSDSQALADAKYNLAEVKFRMQSFAESAVLHREALGLYRELYGEDGGQLLIAGRTAVKLDLREVAISNQEATFSSQQDQNVAPNPVEPVKRLEKSSDPLIEMSEYWREAFANESKQTK